MKKYLLFGILGLILTSSVYSYSMPIKVNGANLKFMNEKIDKQNCFDIINSVPIQYQEGITYFIYHEMDKQYGGFYYWYSKTINLYNGCDKETIAHELAHYKNIAKDKLKIYNTYRWNVNLHEYEHTELFYDAFDEIYGAIK